MCCFAAVEPTYSYYEKVSEELQKIVHEVKEKEEVKPLSDGENHFSVNSSSKCEKREVVVEVVQADAPNI